MRIHPDRSPRISVSRPHMACWPDPLTKGSALTKLLLFDSPQRGSPVREAARDPLRVGSVARLPRSIFTGVLLVASVVLTLGALGGTALADVPSRDATTSAARQMATDKLQDRQLDRSAVVERSDVSSRVPTREPVVSLDSEASSVKEAASAVIAEAELRTGRSIESPRALSGSEPESSSSLTTAEVEAEPVTMAAVEPTSGHDVNQCNADEFPTGAGFEVTCEVTIVNTITEEGDESSTVTTRTCLAFEGVLPPAGCTGPVTTTSGELVTSVDQCNGIVNGGGSNVTCDVTVVNNVPVGTATTPITVNQCNGSGEGGTSPVGDPLNCSGPTDQDTTDADVNQCNGSANGGGAPGRVECSVVGEESAVPLTIDQCNDSANGGGSTVTCTVTVTNNFIEPGEDGPDEDGPDEDGPGEDEPDEGGAGEDEPDEGGPVAGGPGAGGPATGGTGGGGTDGDMPSAITPVAFVTPSSASPAGASGLPQAASGTQTKVAASGSELSSLPATGSDIGSMSAMGLMAMMLGGLLILVSRSAARFSTNG